MCIVKNVAHHDHRAIALNEEVLAATKDLILATENGHSIIAISHPIAKLKQISLSENVYDKTSDNTTSARLFISTLLR